MTSINWKRKLAHTKRFDYDDWLEYFRNRFTAATLMAEQGELEQHLPPDGYAALQRWIEIFENPSKMDKLYKGRLDNKENQDILKVAIGDDDEAFYIALIQKSTKQLESSSASQQEVARLTQNLDIFRTKLREIRSRKPKEGTMLARVLEEAAKPRVAKSSGKVNKGASAKKKTTSSEAVGTPKKKKTGIASPKKGKKR